MQRAMKGLPVLPPQMKAHRAEGSAREAANVALVRATLAALDAHNEAEFLAKMADDAVVDEMVERQPFAGDLGNNRRIIQEPPAPERHQVRKLPRRNAQLVLVFPREHCHQKPIVGM